MEVGGQTSVTGTTPSILPAVEGVDEGSKVARLLRLRLPGRGKLRSVATISIFHFLIDCSAIALPAIEIDRMKWRRTALVAF